MIILTLLFNSLEYKEMIKSSIEVSGEVFPGQSAAAATFPGTDEPGETEPAQGHPDISLLRDMRG